ncbi:MAG: hypothetical protein ACPLRY_07535 [Candidatus Bathyarchaeales archaeon]
MKSQRLPSLEEALLLLRDGKVTFAKAAEVAKLSLLEFADLVKQRKKRIEKLGKNKE